MNDSAVRTLLGDLLEQTEDGRREWAESERDGFFTAFRAGTFAVRRKRTSFRAEHDELVRADQFLVQVVTADGEVVLERAFVGPAGFDLGETSDVGFSAVRDLWNAARETARNADELLEAILREVRGELQTAA